MREREEWKGEETNVGFVRIMKVLQNPQIGTTKGGLRPAKVEITAAQVGEVSSVYWVGLPTVYGIRHTASQ